VKKLAHVGIQTDFKQQQDDPHFRKQSYQVIDLHPTQQARPNNNAGKQLTNHAGATHGCHHLAGYPGCNQYDKKL